MSVASEASDTNESTLEGPWNARDFAEVTARAISEFGPDVLRFLCIVHNNRDDAAEVFAQACEDLYRSLPTYRRHCHLRTWFYAIAKHASLRHFNDAFRRRAVFQELPDLAASVRTTTASYLRTEWKTRLRALRGSLAPDDRALLVLRVDRGLPWSEIAIILLGDDAKASHAAAMRKRFERIKSELRRRAESAGWFAER